MSHGNLRSVGALYRVWKVARTILLHFRRCQGLPCFTGELAPCVSEDRFITRGILPSAQIYLTQGECSIVIRYMQHPGRHAISSILDGQVGPLTSLTTG
ncbi:hypothetical protein HBI51_247410 [Parastagonospora nodorum]|nr:hypothetical protein HBI51_247410 [Parastagonospora nodorum]